jgi:hypothetical protein
MTRKEIGMPKFEGIWQVFVWFNLRIVLIVCLLAVSLYAQKSSQDTLDIRYEIISQKFHTDETIVKIKLPPYLSTGEVMEQIKLAVQWPGEPPPEKLTYIYVFRDANQIGDSSRTGATYVPGKGFVWQLTEWEPIEFPHKEPTQLEKVIYNTLLDSMFAHGLSMHNVKIKEKVAKKFDITVSKLDSIYFKVKYWQSY